MANLFFIELVFSAAWHRQVRARRARSYAHALPFAASEKQPGREIASGYLLLSGSRPLDDKCDLRAHDSSDGPVKTQAEAILDCFPAGVRHYQCRLAEKARVLLRTIRGSGRTRRTCGSKRGGASAYRASARIKKPRARLKPSALTYWKRSSNSSCYKST